VSSGGGVSAVVLGAMMDVGLAAGGGPGAATLSGLTAAEGGVTGSPAGELTTESTPFGLPTLTAGSWTTGAGECGGAVVVGGVGVAGAWTVDGDAATDAGLVVGDGTTIASALGGRAGWPKTAMLSGT
jgi:hypothetical protein